MEEHTAQAIIYADSNTIESGSISAKVVFDGVPEEDKIEQERVDTKVLESNIELIEKSTQDSIVSAYNAYVEEQERKRVEEELARQREEEARKKAEAARLAQATEVKGSAILSYNPFVKSGLSVEQYNIILSGTGLEGCGQSYYNMEQTYGVNGLFAIGVAFHESGYGRHRANTNNFYGMRGNSGWMSFSSPDENIQYFGKLMNKSLYKGKSIDGIGSVYCPGTSSSWASAVRSMMKSSFAKI